VYILGFLGIYNLNSNHTHALINSLMLTATNAQVLLLLIANGFVPSGSVLQCKTGQYNTVQYNTVQ